MIRSLMMKSLQKKVEKSISIKLNKNYLNMSFGTISFIVKKDYFHFPGEPAAGVSNFHQLRDNG